MNKQPKLKMKRIAIAVGILLAVGALGFAYMELYLGRQFVEIRLENTKEIKNLIISVVDEGGPSFEKVFKNPKKEIEKLRFKSHSSGIVKIAVTFIDDSKLEASSFHAGGTNEKHLFVIHDEEITGNP